MTSTGVSNTTGLWVGNGFGSSATFTINGGAVTVATGTVLGRDQSSGVLMISSATFTTGAYSPTIGTYFAPSYVPAGTGVITIGNGGSYTLSDAATNPFQFGGLTVSSTNTTTNFLNFTSGSTGNITLNLTAAGLGSAYFNNLISNGYVKIGNTVDTNLSHYIINTSNLAAAKLTLIPEPGAAFMVFSGFGALALFQRSRRM